jgi:T5SS/PEP-CTERM-associated repeat protein
VPIYAWNVNAGVEASYFLASNWTLSAATPIASNVAEIGAGSVVTAAGDVDLGLSVGQFSTLVLDGARTSLNAGGLGTGVFGAGRVAIDNGATLVTTGAGGVDSIGYEAGGNGTVAIDGIASRWISKAAFVNVGYQGHAVLTITNGGALSMAGYLAVASAPGGTALVTLVGPTSSIVASDGVMVDGGGGRLRVFTGAVMTTGGSVDRVGDLSGAGLASVSGPGAMWLENAQSLVIAAPSGSSDLMLSDGGALRIAHRVDVGDTAMNGRIDIRAGGSLIVTAPCQNAAFLVEAGAAAGSAGTIDVAGAGATLDTGGNPLALGELGAGTLDIGAGASVTSGVSDDTQLDAAPALMLGALSGGVGVLTIDGAGAALHVNGGGFAGSGGTARIAISDGGELVAGDAASNASGFGFSIGAGAASPGSTRIISGGSAALTIASGGTLLERNSFSVGSRGGTGSVVVGASGVLEFAGQMAIGNGDTVAGAGSGSVTIAAGGTLAALGPTLAAPVGSANMPALIVGDGQYGNTGAAGTLDARGVGALVNLAGYGIAVGGAAAGDVANGGGSGTLTVEAGATLLCGGSAAAPALAIGAAANASGVVTVTGAGSSLLANGSVVVGQYGTASLAVLNGATLDATGGITIAAGGAVRLEDAVASGQIFDFSGAAGRLEIDDPIDFHGQIDGFQAGDTLTIAGLGVAGLTISVAGGDTVLHPQGGGAIDFDGLYGPGGIGLLSLLGLASGLQAQNHPRTTASVIAADAAAPANVPSLGEIAAQTAALQLIDATNAFVTGAMTAVTAVSQAAISELFANNRLTLSMTDIAVGMDWASTSALGLAASSGMEGAAVGAWRPPPVGGAPDDVWLAGASPGGVPSPAGSWLTVGHL